MPLYTIPCSFGEIIDKLTILEIKLSKATGLQKDNIQAEYDALKVYLTNPTAEYMKFLDELRTINRTLWDLEDDIRIKSQQKKFDASYIQIAEAIHTTNDRRYQVKRSLNTLMGSSLVEEKILPIVPIVLDRTMFEKAMGLFMTGNYEASFQIFEKLCEKHRTDTPSAFLCELLSSYDTNAAFLGVPNKYISLMDSILPQTKDFIADDVHRRHILQGYGLHLMRRKEYGKATEYLRFMNAVTAPGISPETMSMPPFGSIDKTLLIYMGGGIGDKIMFARFIPHVCERLLQNKVNFLVDDSLVWIFTRVFNCSNLTIIPFSRRNEITFDYHINIHMLPHFLGLEYKDIYSIEFLSTLNIESPIKISGGKRKILFNWHGNYANQLERINRGAPLNKCIPLLAMKEFQWISTQKEFNAEEDQIMKKYKVLNLGSVVDKNGDSYRDTLAVMQQVDLVISTDTSFVHVAGTAGISCWVLLSKGCEWRWTQDKTTRWYPNLRLFRQNTFGDWAEVVSRVKEALKET